MSKVWIEEAVKNRNWQMIAEDDTGDASPELQIAASIILELKEDLQDALWNSMGDEL